MQISGINKFSLIDFPGEISCIVFTPGCNFRCGFCHNSEFVLPEKLKSVYKKLIPQEAIFNFLKERNGKITGVSICGGEPTLQKDLKDFCSELKKLGLKVKLDTNGRDPKIIQDLIDEKLVDYIAMDIKHEAGKINLISGIKENEEPYLKSIDTILNSSIDYEFRTTVVNGIHSKETIKNISKILSGAKKYYLQNYKDGNTLNPDFKGKSFTQKELIDFQKIASEYVKNVFIRN